MSIKATVRKQNSPTRLLVLFFFFFFLSAHFLRRVLCSFSWGAKQKLTAWQCKTHLTSKTADKTDRTKTSPLTAKNPNNRVSPDRRNKKKKKRDRSKKHAFVLENMKIWWKLYNNTGRRVDPARVKEGVWGRYSNTLIGWHYEFLKKNHLETWCNLI